MKSLKGVGLLIALTIMFMGCGGPSLDGEESNEVLNNANAAEAAPKSVASNLTASSTAPDGTVESRGVPTNGDANKVCWVNHGACSNHWRRACTYCEGSSHPSNCWTEYC